MKSNTPRLLAAAKELNISKENLVKYLLHKGYDVRQYKPNQKLTSEMYQILKNKFYIEKSVLLVANKFNVSKSRLLEFLSGKGFDIHTPSKSIIEKLSDDMLVIIDSDFLNYLIESKEQHTHTDRRVTNPLSTQKELTIEWKDVKFEDYEMRFKVDGHYTNQYTVPDSRKSYKYLQNYIVGLNFEPLKVLIKRNKVIQVENIQYLKEVIKIIKVRQEYKEQFDAEKPVSVKKIIDIIHGISPDLIAHIVKGRDVDESINFLCEHQNQADRIIPVLEINRSGDSVIEQDAFIFTIRHDSNIFLIWESTVKGKATYIFKTTESEMMDQLQSIFDYISSSLSLKRTKLREGAIETSELNYLCYITHATFEGWKSKMMRAIFG